MEATRSLEINDFNPGVIGIPSGGLGRYREFDRSLNSSQIPHGSVVDLRVGVNTSFSMNQIIRTMLANEKYEWLWLLGDDHVFKPDLLLNLLRRNVDIVTPMCLRRSKPFYPVINGSGLYGFAAELSFDYFNGKEGIIDVTGERTTGNAGMLIKRRVLEKMPSPWFTVGQINPEMGSTDLYFSMNAVRHGFRLHLDTDNTIGHILHAAVWPSKIKDEDGNVRYEPDLMVP